MTIENIIIMGGLIIVLSGCLQAYVAWRRRRSLRRAFDAYVAAIFKPGPHVYTARRQQEAITRLAKALVESPSPLRPSKKT